jgi:hypothetical protein
MKTQKINLFLLIVMLAAFLSAAAKFIVRKIHSLLFSLEIIEQLMQTQFISSVTVKEPSKYPTALQSSIMFLQMILLIILH